MSHSLPERPKLPTPPTAPNFDSKHLSSTSTTNSIPPTTFPQFPLLPTEIRLQIYILILNQPTSQLPSHTHTTRILKLTYSPSARRYISNCPPPPTLSICAESRAFTLSKNWEWLQLGPNYSPSPCTRIPVVFGDTCVYISGTFSGTSVTENFFNNLHWSHSKQRITSLALDLRIFPQLSGYGLVALLAGMKSLREVFIVVEFGRRELEGELGFLEMPAWRCDLNLVAANVKEKLNVERRQRNLSVSRGAIEAIMDMEDMEDVDVRSVLLTRGEEQV